MSHHWKERKHYPILCEFKFISGKIVFINDCLKYGTFDVPGRVCPECGTTPQIRDSPYYTGRVATVDIFQHHSSPRYYVASNSLPARRYIPIDCSEQNTSLYPTTPRDVPWFVRYLKIVRPNRKRRIAVCNDVWLLTRTRCAVWLLTTTANIRNVDRPSSANRPLIVIYV